MSLKDKKHCLNKNKKGFTLIELLVVIAILAVLMSVVVITLNPAEMLRKSRDTKRISDLATLRTALTLYLAENPTLGGDSTYAYLSLPATSGTTCDGVPLYGGRSTNCTSTTNLQKVDSNGWIPVNFSTGITTGAPISALPVDPTNATTPQALYYVYAISASSDYFELNANMESSYYSSGSSNVENSDGGNNINVYEVGSKTDILN